MSTLLDGVNEVLKRAAIIDSDGGELASLTDSSRQVWVDTAIQCWNEAIDDLYSLVNQPLPTRFAEATIVLATGDRDYALQSASRIFFPFRETTSGYRIEEYKAGYQSMVNGQLVPANYTGRALFACIRPSDGQLYLERIPTSSENGLTYTYGYEADTALSAAADTMPFSESCFRAMVPVVTQLWSREQQRQFDPQMYQANLGRAARFLRRMPARDTWTPERSYASAPANFLNPFGDA